MRWSSPGKTERQHFFFCLVFFFLLFFLAAVMGNNAEGTMSGGDTALCNCSAQQGLS